MMVEQKIDKSNVEDILELPKNQQGMLFHYLKDPTSISFNSQIWVDVEGPFDPDMLKQAVDQVQEHNEVLRSVFRWKGVKKPLQIILKQVELAYQYVDLSDQDEQAQVDRIKELQDTYWNDRFDLALLPVKMFVVKKSDDAFVLSITHHHILYDGWSSSIFVNEILQYYGHLYHGKEPNLAKPTYKAFYQTLRQKESANDLAEYWTSNLAGFHKQTSVYPKMKGTREVNPGEPNRLQLKISAQDTNGLNQLSHRLNVTVSHVLQSAWGVLLSRYNHSKDVAFGSVFSGRPTEFKGMEKVMGMYINTLPLRLSFNDQDTFADLFQHTQKQALEAEDYQYSSLTDIQEFAETNGELMDHNFVFQNYPVNKEIAIGDQKPAFLIKDFGFNALPNFDLAVVVVPDQTYTINFFYNPERYPTETINQIKGQFQNLISFLANSEEVEETSIAAFDLLNDADKAQLKSQTGATENTGASATFLDLFHAQVATNPDLVAVKDAQSQLTYKELSDRADALAEMLQRNFIQSTVALVRTAPTVDMMVAIVGAMKGGLPYIPLDPEQLSNRQTDLLNQFEDGVLLTTETLAKEVTFAGSKILLEAVPESPTSNVEAQVNPDDTAYIIFTSGTSGTPKGVQISHGNLYNYSSWAKDFLELDHNDASVLSSSFAFDLGYTSIIPVLASGGTLNLIERAVYQSPDDLLNYIEQHQITYIKMTPSLFATLVDASSFANKDFSKLRNILLGGESIDPNDIQTFKQQYDQVQFINHYGPSETTIGVIAQKITDLATFSEQPTIGQPIENTNVYILDQQGMLAPYGAIGELCIAGDSVGKGYYQLDEMTQAKFIQLGDERLYRTGDLARWLPNGMIEFLGRADDQVKIRGYRVELRDVAAHMQGHDQISKAVVITRGEDGQKFMVGYFVPAAELNSDDLKHYLEAQLPDYMIPTFLVPLESIPLTKNNKVDIAQLPEPEMEMAAVNHEELTPLQEALRSIWAGILKIEEESIGLGQSFFELGGHSLKAIELANKLNKNLNVKVSLNLIFKYATIEKMAAYVEELEQEKFIKISKAPVKAAYNLSSAQERMYFLHEFDKESLAYNMPYVARLNGLLDQEKFREAFRNLILRHESLRTRIEVENGVTTQVIEENSEFEVAVIQADAAQVPALIEAFIQPFDLGQTPLIRVQLVELSAYEHVMMVDMHHVITDGVSRGILIKDLMALYQGESLKPLQLQYKDYAEWQRQAEQLQQVADHRKFWMSAFSDEPPLLDLPTDFERPKIKHDRGAKQTISISAAQTAQLRQLAEQEDATMFMTLFAIFNVFLSKISNQEDIVIGSPVAGRQHADLEGIVGLFVNSLPLRNFPKSDTGFADFLKEVRTRTLKSFEHQSYPFEDLVNDLKINRDTSRQPLFDTMFALQNFNLQELSLAGIELRSFDYYSEVAKFDLSLIAFEAEDSLMIEFEYRTDLFKAETIERFMGYFSNIIAAVVETPDAKIGQINLLHQQESAQLLSSFNETKVDYPEGLTVMDLFHQQAALTPEHIAIRTGDYTCTYEELELQANQFATFLIEKENIQKGDLVGILLNREAYLIPVIYGILKAGAVFIPLDPENPVNRINTILTDAGIKKLISRQHLLNAAEITDSELIFLDDCLDTILNLQVAENVQLADSTDLAYIIYTSGSTGKPKGVMVEHASLFNMISCLQNRYPLMSEDVYLMKTNYCFDVSLTEIFGWFLAGGTLSILAPGAEKDPARIINQIEQHGVTHLNFVPSAFGVFLDELSHAGVGRVQSLKYAFLAGEQLPLETVKRFNELLEGVVLENIYGPTEGTIYTTWYSLENLGEATRVPIGKPLDNVQVYVLDEFRQLVPVGVSGELHISGAGVARGYHKNPELTAEKFIDNPFQKGQKMYRTGDLVKWLPDGNIEFLGRLDHQVKVRGFRIELGEIENKLNDILSVRESLVMVPDMEDQQIVAYYVSDESIDSTVLTDSLSRALPSYMLPNHFVHMEKMPLNANGKIDRKALPALTLTVTGTFMAPENALETRLQEIWSDLLNIPQEELSVTGNFFEYGGHSLKAVLLVNQLRAAFEIKVSVQNIFEYQTIRSLGQFMKGQESFRYEGITQAPLKEFYRVSSAQQRMYFLNEFEEESLVNNMFESVSITGAIDHDRLNEAFANLIRRHEALRTRFEVVDGEIVQFIAHEIDFEVEQLQATTADATQAVRDFITPFDLSVAPLFQVGLIRVDQEKHILVINMHHIISDGLSIHLLIKDFLAMYNGDALPEQQLQYKDFAEWQRMPERAEELEEQRAFWLDYFQTTPEAIELPLDFKRPVIKNTAGAIEEVTLSKEQVDQLRSLALVQEVTPYITLLTLFNVLLSKLSNQSDIVVGTPVAGRPHAGIESVVGLFMNTLAIRSQVNDQLTFADLLSQAKSNVLTCFDNQHYHFEDLIDDLKVKRDTSRNPLFDVMFSYQDGDKSSLSIPGLEVSSYDHGYTPSKFDLTLTATTFEEEMTLSMTYNPSLFKSETIQRFLQYLVKLMDISIADPTTSVANMDMLPLEELNHILCDLNDTQVNYPADQTIVALFEEQVRSNGEKAALHFEGEDYSYQYLHERSNQLAHHLLQQNVKEETLVGVLLDRSPEMLISLLAVLKAGCAYVPIDPMYPLDRVKYMVTDSGLPLIISSRDQSEITQHLGGAVQVIDVNDSVIGKQPATAVEKRISARSLCYVIYTSGSTGKPKGIMIEHRSVVNFIFGVLDRIDLRAAHSLLSLTTVSFDIFVLETWLPLAVGSRVVLANTEEQLDLEALSELIRSTQVDAMQLTPSRLDLLLQVADDDLLTQVKALMVGGEAFPDATLDLLQQKYQGQIYNMYGPTETTVWSTIQDLTNKSTVDIGMPINNTQTYVLDSKLHPQPKGVVGSLYIGGHGLARGYFNNEKLTQERFIDSPFVPGEKLYQTGDMARYQIDGSLEFLGRGDHQVKIRGYRIELGEVEANISNYNAIEQAVVSSWGEGSQKSLVAYFTASENIDHMALRSFLVDQLPEYMVPSHFMQLDEMPLTPNGKTDRKALPEPEILADEAHVGPANEMEEKLVAIWSEVLEINADRISVTRSFFELGGNSLKSILLISRINREMQIELKVKDLFTKQNIRNIAELISLNEWLFATEADEEESVEFTL